MALIMFLSIKIIRDRIFEVFTKAHAGLTVLFIAATIVHVELDTLRNSAIAICIVNAFWDFTAPLAANLAVKQELVSVHAPAIDAATPGSGVYMNEIDPWYQGDWKETMYGANYDRLLDIKRRYDPDSVFYGHFAVGSDEYAVDGAGRLCKA